MLVIDRCEEHFFHADNGTGIKSVRVLLVLMKLLVLFVVIGSVVESSLGRELDVIDELHIGTFVYLVGVTGAWSGM